MLDDPLDSCLFFSGTGRRQYAVPYSWQATRPEVNLSTDNDAYIIEAEVQGMKRESLDVCVGNGGRGMTIEVHVIRDGGSNANAAMAPASASKSDTTKAWKVNQLYLP
jgi:HSP20 family molecular chaperone IbpA